jgi:hypothetical protein
VQAVQETDPEVLERMMNDARAYNERLLADNDRWHMTEAELEEALREYFTTHEDIHVRELARIGHFAVSTAYRKLKAYVEQGKLELVPKSSHYYRWVGE